MEFEPVGQRDFEKARSRILYQQSGKLYPNTPIEVEVDFSTTRSGNKIWSFFVNCEGEYSSREFIEKDVKRRIRELIKINKLLWCHPSMRSNPEWAGWTKMNMATLAEITGESTTDILESD